MTNQPLRDPKTEQLHGQQASFKQLLESAFPPAFPSDPDPEKTIQWIAVNIDKGLSRVYAVNIREWLNARQQERLVQSVSQRIGDSQLIGLLKEILAASSQPEHLSPGPLAPVLADIAFERIDQILQPAKSLGREENFLHVQCTRVGNQLVVLSDRDPRYEWIIPAVQKRLREELSNLHYNPAAIETQSVDMTCGDPLCFLGFELRCVRGKHSEMRVHYRLVDEAGYRPAKTVGGPLGRSHPPRFAQRFLEGMKHLLGWPLLRDAYRQLNAIQVGWRHLPITLFPVLLYLFTWHSPIPWLCFLLIFVCNWRRTLALATPMGIWAGRHKLDLVLGVCALVALICLLLGIRDLGQPSP